MAEPAQPLSAIDDAKNEATRLEDPSSEDQQRKTESSSDLNEGTDQKQEDKEEETDEDRDYRIRIDEDIATDIPLTSTGDAKSDDEGGQDSATLPLNQKKDQDPLEFPNPPIHKKKVPIYLFPLTRMKIAWANSTSICEFFVKAALIIFSTLGWFFCIGGFPLMAIVQLIIGSVYINDCRIQPNIPVYLIVSGVFGTVQHIIAVWTKYVPKGVQGRMKVVRAYCMVLDGAIQIFLLVWFVCGCIWVYGAFSEVDFEDRDFEARQVYCNATVYLFAFWTLNISFILLALLVAATLCCILCIVALPKEEVEIEAKP